MSKDKDIVLNLLAYDSLKFLHVLCNSYIQKHSSPEIIIYLQAPEYIVIYSYAKKFA